MRLQIARLAAAVLATAAAGLGLVASTSAPAAAAACSGATGVTVVVDHGALGGGVDQVCNSGGGGHDAISLFTGAGFSLTYVQSQPGFVCRINGQPASDPCVRTPPSDAYWGLWWSDGRSGTWSYSSLGAGSLTVPDGGYVAFRLAVRLAERPNVVPTPHASHPAAGADADRDAVVQWWRERRSGNGGGGHGSATPTAKPSSKPSSKPPATSSAAAAPTPTASASLASAHGQSGPDERRGQPHGHVDPGPVRRRRAHGVGLDDCGHHRVRVRIDHSCGDRRCELQRHRGSAAGVGGAAGPPRAGGRWRGGVPVAPTAPD
jgi:hypothetical protein